MLRRASLATYAPAGADTASNDLLVSQVPRMNVSRFKDSKDIQHVTAVDNALQSDGILIMNLKFDDPQSDYLLQIVQSLQAHGHGSPLVHSSIRGWLWDVKPTAKGPSQDHIARSETMDRFPWHTDCSYTSHPPKFFALHVLHADQFNGGTLSVMPVSRLLAQLTLATRASLSAPEFQIQVPPEFANGIDSITASLLAPMDADGAVTGVGGAGNAWSDVQPQFRYRADIIQPLTERADKALTELNRVVSTAKDGNTPLCIHLDAHALPSGSIILLDNHRWLHTRSAVKDAQRHLRRIRWHSLEFGVAKAYCSLS